MFIVILICNTWEMGTARRPSAGEWVIKNVLYIHNGLPLPLGASFTPLDWCVLA